MLSAHYSSWAALTNGAQDSLLATPLILDLTILTELLTRVKYRDVSAQAEFAPLYPVLSLLSYMLKAPLVKPGASPLIIVCSPLLTLLQDPMSSTASTASATRLRRSSRRASASRAAATSCSRPASGK